MLRKAVSGSAAFSTAGTVFCGVFVQAIPFLALGVVVSGLIAVFVSPERLARWLPRRPAVAVLAAGVGGAVLPGCECGSVPVGRRLFGERGAHPCSGRGGVDVHAGRSGDQPGGAGRHRGRVSRCADDGCRPDGGVAADRGDHGLGVGAVGPPGVGHPPAAPLGTTGTESRWVLFAEAARHDFLQAASYLVVGAAAAAALHVVVPRWVFDHLAAHLILGVAVMAALAVVLALCSEADAFVAASMTMVPLLPRLVFLVVGPAVDVKLFAMQAGMFGRAFAARFAPGTLLVAMASACAVGLFGSRWSISEPRNREHRSAAGGHQHRHDHGDRVRSPATSSPDCCRGWSRRRCC